MQNEIFHNSDPIFGFTWFELAIIFTGAALICALPILILVSAILKLRRFPHRRTLHILLLISCTLAVSLAIIGITSPEIIPIALRTSGVWSFTWIFAFAWLAVTWSRSALKTGLRTQALDVATLAVVASLFVLALVAIFVML